jgi:N-acetylmuramoyl-L-alanine amidase
MSQLARKSHLPHRNLWLGLLGALLLSSPAHAHPHSLSDRPDRPEQDYSTVEPDDREIAATGAATLLEDIEIKDEGFILHTRGQQAQFDLKPSSDRSWVSIDLPGVSLSPELARRTLNVERWGVERLQVIQLSSTPPMTRVTLSLDESAPNWQARSNGSGQVLVWPEGSAPPGLARAQSGLVRIEGVELSEDGSRVTIKADGPIAYTSNWDRHTSAYMLTIYSAELAWQGSLTRPNSDSPVLWVRGTQEDPETVAIRILPAAGAQIGNITQNGDREISLQLSRGPTPSNLPNANNRPPIPTAPPAEKPSSVPQVPQTRLAIVIDPGHGGRDPGAVGIGGLQEKDVVLDISEKVAQILEQNGVTVVMTRQDDRTLDLAPRTQLANRVNADLFVSIHANAVAGKRPEVNGLETFYYSSGRELAGYIQNSMIQSFNTMPNRGVKQARFYVLRHTRMPAVLVETGFVTGRDDSRILADPAQRSRMAEAIARGILNYVRDRR